MKILHFCMHAPFTENYSYQDNLLTEYQHKHGHTVRIVTTTRTRGADGKYIYTEPGFKTLDNGVELVRIEVRSRLRNAFGLYKGLEKHMEDFRPDLIFIHGLCSFISGTAVRYKKRVDPNVHIVADNHQDARITATKGFMNKLSRVLFRRAWKRSIKDIDKVYGTTSWRKEFAHEYFGIPYEKLDVLLTGIDEDALPADREEVRLGLREEMDIPANGFAFVSGGKLDAEKKVLEALRAFSRLKEKDVYFIVFGSVAEDIKKEFFELTGKDKRVRYVGYLSSAQVKNYYIASDFGVFPGRHSVLWEEAVGFGLPCLFRRYGEKDDVEVCDNCICTDDTDEDGLYRYMERVVSDKEYYARLKKNSEEAAKKFSYHTIAEKSTECCSK